MSTKEELIQKATVRAGYSNSITADIYGQIMSCLIDIVREEERSKQYIKAKKALENHLK